MAYQTTHRFRLLGRHNHLNGAIYLPRLPADKEAQLHGSNWHLALRSSKPAALPLHRTQGALAGC